MTSSDPCSACVSESPSTLTKEDLDAQIKLGPGGLRDIEFSVQLLQLVHGQHDEKLRLAGTLPALRALVRGGYVAREDGERLANDYRTLRVLEHRLQLRELRRTALMPADEHGLNALARSSRLATTGQQLYVKWKAVRSEIRELHLKIFLRSASERGRSAAPQTVASRWAAKTHSRGCKASGFGMQRVQ